MEVEITPLGSPSASPDCIANDLTHLEELLAELRSWAQSPTQYLTTRTQVETFLSESKALLQKELESTQKGNSNTIEIRPLFEAGVVSSATFGDKLFPLTWKSNKLLNLEHWSAQALLSTCIMISELIMLLIVFEIAPIGLIGILCLMTLLIDIINILSAKIVVLKLLLKSFEWWFLVIQLFAAGFSLMDILRWDGRAGVVFVILLGLFLSFIMDACPLQIRKTSAAVWGGSIFACIGMILCVHFRWIPNMQARTINIIDLPLALDQFFIDRMFTLIIFYIKNFVTSLTSPGVYVCWTSKVLESPKS